MDPVANRELFKFIWGSWVSEVSVFQKLILLFCVQSRLTCSLFDMVSFARKSSLVPVANSEQF